MLSRTAENLYWLSRYVERAENLARIIEAAHRLAGLPTDWAGHTNEWESALIAAGCANGFRELHDEATPETVIEYIAFSPRNPSSIRRCLETARANARAERTALTLEMWESINGTWLAMQRMDPQRAVDDLPGFLSWVKGSSLDFDGTAYRTMLRNDAYCFSRLGVYLERADNTARVLDVKYHVLLPDNARVGGGLDYYQWSAILRSVSALTSYHWVYRESLKPWLIADLLILRAEMPRSLASCHANISMFLDDLAGRYGRQGRSQRLARTIHSRLSNRRMEDIFQSGLHEFVQEFLAENGRLGQAITEQYLA